MPQGSGAPGSRARLPVVPQFDRGNYHFGSCSDRVVPPENFSILSAKIDRSYYDLIRLVPNYDPQVPATLLQKTSRKGLESNHPLRGGYFKAQLLYPSAETPSKKALHKLLQKLIGGFQLIRKSTCPWGFSPSPPVSPLDPRGIKGSGGD